MRNWINAQNGKIANPFPVKERFRNEIKLSYRNSY